MNKDFDIEEVESLNLVRGPRTVDIGFLAGETHRQAFADIFSRMCTDNAALLEGCRLQSIEGKRPIRHDLSLPAEIGADESTRRLGLALYDGLCEEVVLRWTGPSTFAIKIEFDNPKFTLSELDRS